MPTVIDELVVEVSLNSTVGKDVSKESAAIQKELDNLREKAKGSTEGFEKALNNLSPAAKKVHAEAMKRARVEWSAIGKGRKALEEQSKKAIKTQVELGNVSRRTGSAIAAGTRTGTEGLSALASTALTAYAAIESVHGIMDKIGQAASQGAQTGRAAYFAGVDTQWLSAYEIYVRKVSHVPFEETENTLNSFGQKLQAYKTTGAYSDEFTALARFANIGDVRNLDLPTLLRKLYGVVGKEGQNGPLAQYLAGQFGFQSQTIAMARGQGALNSGLAEALPIAETKQQADDLIALEGAISNVHAAWDGLVRKIVTDNPQWKTTVDHWHDWLVDVQSTPEGLHAVEVAAGAVSVAIGVTLGAAVWKFSKAVLAANAEMLASPLGRLLLIGAVAGYGLSPSDPGTKDLEAAKTPEDRTKAIKQKLEENKELQREIDEFRKENNIGWGANAMRNLMGGYVGYEPFEAWRKKKGYDTANPLPMIYGKPGQDGNTSSGMPSAGPPSNGAEATGIGGPNPNNPGNIRPEGGEGFNTYSSPQDGISAMDHLLSVYGSRHGINTLAGVISRYAPPNENPTAQLIANAASRTGLDPNAPIDLSDPDVRKLLIIKGLLPQEQGANATPYQALAAQILGKPSNVIAFPGAGSPDNSWFTNQARNSRAVQAIGAGGPSGQVSNNQTSQVNVGSVNISTPSADPAQHGTIVSDTIRSSMLASNVNSGLE